MITEWGPNGYWEAPKTTWEVSIEQTSTEKKAVYFERYKKHIEPFKTKCLGSYAFFWGSKQEYTETWFGLFAKDGVATEPIAALEIAIEGIQHQIDLSTGHRITFFTSPTTLVYELILDDLTYGTIDAENVLG